MVLRKMKNAAIAKMKKTPAIFASVNSMRFTLIGWAKTYGINYTCITSASFAAVRSSIFLI